MFFDGRTDLNEKAFYQVSVIQTVCDGQLTDAKIKLCCTFLFQFGKSHGPVIWV